MSLLYRTGKLCYHAAEVNHVEQENNSELFRRAVEAVSALGGGWLCVREYTPRFHELLQVSMQTEHRLHYHPSCRMCHRVRGNRLCESEHGEKLRERCLAEKGPFWNTCWSGVKELIIPVHTEKGLAAAIHLGGFENEAVPLPELLKKEAGIPPEISARARESLGHGDEDRMFHAGELFFCTLSALIRLSGHWENETSEMTASRYVTEARIYVQDHLMEPGLSVTNIASRLGVTREYFSRLFRKETGGTVRDYILSARFQRAALLLENTSVPVGTVAMRCGFSDPSYFSRAFRGRFGETPEGFRASRRRGPTEI